MYDSLSRKQLDDRNSSENHVDLWQEVCDDYNLQTYAPMSCTFPDLHSKFRIPIELVLPDNAVPMAPENAKRLIRDMNGRFKKGNTGWRASGNGKESKGKDGEVVRLLLNGTDYIEGQGEASTERDVVIKYVDDDRYGFCNDDLGTAYFWGYVEMVGLTDFALQNVEAIGLIGGKVNSARDGLSKLSRDRQNHRSSIETAIADLPRTMQRSLATFLDKDTGRKEMSRREDHYRKANALYASMSNDYEDAKLRMMEYKYGPNAVGEVVEAHAKIVKAKQDRARDAKRDLDRCIEEYNSLLLDQPDQDKDQGDRNKSDSSKEDYEGSAEEDCSDNDHGGDSDVSLVKEGEDKDVRDLPTDKMVVDAEADMDFSD